MRRWASVGRLGAVRSSADQCVRQAASDAPATSPAGVPRRSWRGSLHELSAHAGLFAQGQDASRGNDSGSGNTTKAGATAGFLRRDKWRSYRPKRIGPSSRRLRYAPDIRIPRPPGQSTLTRIRSGYRGAAPTHELFVRSYENGPWPLCSRWWPLCTEAIRWSQGSQCSWRSSRTIPASVATTTLGWTLVSSRRGFARSLIFRPRRGLLGRLPQVPQVTRTSWRAALDDAPRCRRREGSAALALLVGGCAEPEHKDIGTTDWPYNRASGSRHVRMPLVTHGRSTAPGATAFRGGGRRVRTRQRRPQRFPHRRRGRRVLAAGASPGTRGSLLR